MRVDFKRSDLKNEQNIIVMTPFAKKQMMWHLNLRFLSKTVEPLSSSHFSIVMELGSEPLHLPLPRLTSSL